MLSNVFFFRVSASIFTIGITFLSLIIPMVVNQQNQILFTSLDCFAGGGLFGIGFISSVYESNVDLKTDSRIVWLLASFSFLLLLAFENILLQPKTYASLTQKENYSSISRDLEEDESTDDIELNTVKVDSNSEDDGDSEIDSHDLVSEQLLLHSKRIFPFGVIIIFLSLFGLVRGLVLGSTKHEDYGLLMRYLIDKAVVSLGIGSHIAVINGINSRLITSAMVGFSFVDAIGITLGGFVFADDFNNSSSFVMFLRKFHVVLDGYCTAIAAGLYIYIAVMYILSGRLDVNRINVESSRLPNVVAAISGYVIAVTLCLQYTA